MLGDDVVNDWVLELNASVHGTTKGLYEHFADSLPGLLQRIEPDKIGNLIDDLQRLVDRYRVHLGKCVVLFVSMERIKSALERDASFTWASVSTFKSRREIKDVLQSLHEGLRELGKTMPKGAD